MAITHFRGGTSFTGESVDFFRLCTMRAAVGLELKGIKIRRRAVWTAVKKEFGITGNKQAVYDWLCAKVEELRPQQEHIDKEGL